MSHSLLSPSAAGRWVKCPGSVAMCQQFPEERSSNSADEGTAAHWIGSTALEGKPMPPAGVRAPNGVVTTVEMVECAGVYVAAALPAAQGATVYAVEQHMTCSHIHPECHGTPDLWYWQPTVSEIHVWDYKHGHGLVEAEENWQLMVYAIGALQQVTATLGRVVGIFDPAITVVLHIVQPRAFHAMGPIREWRITADALRPYYDRLRAAALAAMQGGLCNSGPQCRYCSGRRACEALQHAAMIAVDYTASTLACELSPEALAIELRTLQRCSDLVKARLTGLEQQAIGAIQAGQVVPGFAMEYGKGRAIWNKPVGEIIALGEMMGVTLAAPQEAITPAQAKKLGLDAELLACYSETPSTGLKLVNSSKSSAARVFGAVTAAGG